MPPPGQRLTRSQARDLDAASRRRADGHARVEKEWNQAVADLVAAGVAVKALAEHLGVSRQAIYDWLAKASGN